MFHKVDFTPNFTFCNLMLDSSRRKGPPDRNRRSIGSSGGNVHFTLHQKRKRLALCVRNFRRRNYTICNHITICS